MGISLSSPRSTGGARGGCYPKITGHQEKEMNSKAHILVVDDNRSVVRIIEVLLQREGFEVLTAFDGLEGLQKAREEKPDLIILDIVMPRMDGYEVCHLLQDDPDTAAIPVLILTVKGRVNDPSLDDQTIEARIQEQMAGYEAGAIDFLSKPIKARELLNRVRTLLWFDGFPVEGSELGQEEEEFKRPLVLQRDSVRGFTTGHFS
jgi:DNA-binding response OmpR family regulator